MNDVTEALEPILDEAEALVAVAVKRSDRCDRCKGRMMFDPEGDSACFSCGNVVYRLPPLAVTDTIQREPRRRFHAGVDIS